MTLIRHTSLIFLTTVVAFAIWYIPNLPAPSADPPAPFDFLKPSIYVWFYSWRFLFIFLLFFTNALLLALPRFNSHKKEKLYFEKVLKNVIDTEFSQSLSKVRGTIFRVRGGLYAWLHYWRRCRRLLPKSDKDKRTEAYYKNRTPKRNREYLVMYARKGRPNEEKTSTFFLVPNQQEEVDSFTAFVAFDGRACFENLPDISHINLSSCATLDDVSAQDRSIVERYIAEGYISFDSLRVINRISSGLWATPLYNNRDKLWGVLIFDLEQDTKSVHTQLSNRLVSFSKSLTSAIHVYF